MEGGEQHERTLGIVFPILVVKAVTCLYAFINLITVCVKRMNLPKKVNYTTTTLTF